jgi:hypothetical protein
MKAESGAKIWLFAAGGLAGYTVSGDNRRYFRQWRR